MSVYEFMRQVFSDCNLWWNMLDGGFMRYIKIRRDITVACEGQTFTEEDVNVFGPYIVDLCVDSAFCLKPKATVQEQKQRLLKDITL